MRNGPIRGVKSIAAEKQLLPVLGSALSKDNSMAYDQAYAVALKEIADLTERLASLDKEKRNETSRAYGLYHIIQQVCLSLKCEPPSEHGLGCAPLTGAVVAVGENAARLAEAVIVIKARDAQIEEAEYVLREVGKECSEAVVYIRRKTGPTPESDKDTERRVRRGVMDAAVAAVRLIETLDARLAEAERQLTEARGPCKICQEKSDQIRDLFRDIGWSAFAPLDAIKLALEKITSLGDALAEAERQNKLCGVIFNDIAHLLRPDIPKAEMTEYHCSLMLSEIAELHSRVAEAERQRDEARRDLENERQMWVSAVAVVIAARNIST
jgi:hypothetical protein